MSNRLLRSFLDLQNMCKDGVIKSIVLTREGEILLKEELKGLYTPDLVEPIPENFVGHIAGIEFYRDY